MEVPDPNCFGRGWQHLVDPPWCVTTHPWLARTVQLTLSSLGLTGTQFKNLINFATMLATYTVKCLETLLQIYGYIFTDIFLQYTKGSTHDNVFFYRYRYIYPISVPINRCISIGTNSTYCSGTLSWFKEIISRVMTFLVFFIFWQTSTSHLGDLFIFSLTCKNRLWSVDFVTSFLIYGRSKTNEQTESEITYMISWFHNCLKCRLH